MLADVGCAATGGVCLILDCVDKDRLDNPLGHAVTQPSCSKKIQVDGITKVSVCESQFQVAQRKKMNIGTY